MRVPSRYQRLRLYMVILTLTALVLPLSTAQAEDPEILTPADSFDVALGGGYVFWTNLVGEFCSPEGAVTALNLTTRVVSSRRTGCDISPAAVVADDTAVYYAEWASDTIQRIPVGGGTSSTLASASGLIFHRALALDADYVYFGDNQGIKRVLQAGGDVETLFAGSANGRHLAVDDAFVYWDETILGDSQGIKRVPKAGGTVTTIVPASSLGRVIDLTVDATHVYWTESTSKTRRVPKTGGTIVDIAAADPLYQGGRIAVNDTHVYWLDTTGSADGRLRRAPKAGGTIENLALGLFGPTGLNLSASHIYWGDSDGIKRLPLDADVTAVDLTISGLELTQGIQDLANSVPLVADKTTYVRVYPAVDSADTPNVTARLRGFRNGVELPGSPLSPIDPTVYVRTSGANRSRLQDSFTFWVPPDWRSGNVEFRGEINPAGTIPESDRDNNARSVTRTFTVKRPLCVDMVRVRTEPTTASIYNPGFWDIVDWLKAAYPVPDVWIYRGGTIEELQVCIAGIFPYPCGGPYEMPDDSDWVLAKLWTYNLFTNDPGECDDQAYYFGMVHQSSTYQGGAGYRPGDESWGAMNVDANYLGGAFPWYVPHGGSTLAHEIGHNLNRRHVNCGGPANTDPNYPYNACDIGPNDPAGYYGFDVLDLAVIPPTTAGDLMSYAMSVGKPRWPSDYTYRALYNALPNATATTAEAAPDRSGLVAEVIQATENLAVTGVITPDNGTAVLNYAYRVDDSLVTTSKLIDLTARIDTSPTAAYSLRLLDQAGNILREQPFDLPDNGDPVAPTRSFNMIMPFEAQTAAIVLYQGDTELARRQVSSTAPAVTLQSPNGGEVLTGPFTISWTASDPDPETTLLYTVQYSPDAGTTWQTLAADHYTSTLEIRDPTIIPGSTTALLRVIATDGVNTSSDTSNQTFQVGAHAPDVHISRPVSNAVYAPDQPILLIGMAIDAEDGPLAPPQLRWTLNDQVIDTGAEVLLDGLAEGIYTVRLLATDSNNNQSTDSRVIFVGNASRVYLPLLAR